MRHTTSQNHNNKGVNGFVANLYKADKTQDVNLWLDVRRDVLNILTRQWAHGFTITRPLYFISRTLIDQLRNNPRLVRSGRHLHVQCTAFILHRSRRSL